MKKLFSTLMMAMLLVMVSCSEADSPAMSDIRPSEVIPAVDDAVPYDQTELATVFAALDSLNATMPSNVSRGWFGSIIKTLADQAGAVIGKKLGAEKAGRVIASALVDIFIKDEVKDSGVEMAFVFDESIRPSEFADSSKCAIDPGIPLPFPAPRRSPILVDDNVEEVFASTNDDDHIGYQHNYAMCLIANNISSYYSGGLFDYNSLFDQIIDWVGTGNMVSSRLNLLKNEIYYTGQYGLECYLDGSSNDEVIRKFYDQLEGLGIDQQELDIFDNFTAEIALQCLDMSEDEIHDYAVQLQNLLRGLKVSSDIKFELAVIAQCTVNSALFWQQ